ncbi:aldo/keto reductase [Streptomyces sp. NPDC058008]|uniref:aldo/keto reductase n=1 Tax=Streptomyces sp. NPDC058008 TaxID=3346303 RepID=UPI0036E6850C
MSEKTAQVPPPGGTTLLAGRPVARIGFGAMQLPGPGRPAPPPREQSLAVLRRAVDSGVNHIDTSQFYGLGLANELIRAALFPYPDHLVLVSKVGADDRPGGQIVPARRPEQLRDGVERNLATLGVDRLDVVNLRIMDAHMDGSPVGPDQQVPLDDQLAEMTSLRDEGKIGGIGLSNITLEHLNQALPVGIACVQNQYSLLERSGEPLLDICRENAIPWVPFFPLGSAFPGFPKVSEHPQVIEAAEKLDATPAQIGLAWLLATYEHTLLIPGTASIDHLDENIATAQVRLPPETVRSLEDATADRR